MTVVSRHFLYDVIEVWLKFSVQMTCKIIVQVQLRGFRRNIEVIFFKGEENNRFCQNLWGKFLGRKRGSLALGSTALPAKTKILICIL